MPLKKTTRPMLFLSLFLLIYSILRIITVGPVSGPELYIFEKLYDVKIALIIGTCITVFLLVGGGFNITNFDYWPYASIIAILSVGLFISFPLLRGYYLLGSGQSDVLAHIGYVKDIEHVGHVSEDNWYPIIHILLYSWSKFGIELEVVTHFYQAILFVTYVGGLVILVRQVTGSKYALSFGIAIGIIPIFGNYFFSTSPSLASFWILPLLLFCLSVRSIRTDITAIVLILITVFFHPTTTVLLIAIMGILSVTAFLKDRWSLPRMLSLTSVAVTAFIYWLTSFQTRTGPYLALMGVFGLYDRGTGTGQRTAGAALEVPINVMVVRFIEMFGPFALYALGGLLGCFIILYLWISDRNYASYLDWVGQYFVSVIFSIFLLLTTLFGAAFIRRVRYTILMAAVTIILSAVLLAEDKFWLGSMRKFTVVILITILISTTILGMLFTYDNNVNLSEEEYTGASWVVNYHDKNLAIESYTYSDKLTMSVIGRQTYHDTYAGSFGFVEIHRGVKLIELPVTRETAYLFSVQRERQSHLTAHPDLRDDRILYSQDDFENFSNSPMSHKIYSNNASTLWLVKSEHA